MSQANRHPDPNTSNSHPSIVDLGYFIVGATLGGAAIGEAIGGVIPTLAGALGGAAIGIKAGLPRQQG